MQKVNPISKQNPLASFMRQPKIYIRLPSNGDFWPEHSLIPTENMEFPVFSMTAKDELAFKTPDALMNGQAMVDVIQSCLPNIKNAWDCPTLDLDTILIAIRLATYGEQMDLTYKIPVINEEVEFAVDLRQILDQQQQNHWIEQVIINESLIIYVRPLTFKHVTKTSLKSFETNRILNLVNNESLTDEQKIEMFNQSFNVLTSLTVDLISDSIYKIETPDAEVTDSKFIREFVANADKDIFDVVQKHLNSLKEHNEIKSIDYQTTEEQRSQGAPASVKIPLTFNNSDFFAQGF